MATEPVEPDELLFQGTVSLLVPGDAETPQKWESRYLCLWCNPACFAMYKSQMVVGKRAPDHYVFLPPTGSEWKLDDAFSPDGVGCSFMVEAQGGVWHFRTQRSKVDYWRKGFDLVLQIAASRKRPKKSALSRASSQRHRLMAKEGLAFKCDTRQRKWQQRWFEMSGLSLHYFEKQGDAKPKGTVSLAGVGPAFLTDTVDPSGKEPPTAHVLVINTAGRTFPMCFNNPGDIAIWRSWFEESLDLLFGIPADRLEPLPPVSAGELVHEYIDDEGEVVSMSSTPSGMPAAGAIPEAVDEAGEEEEEGGAGAGAGAAAGAGEAVPTPAEAPVEAEADVEAGDEAEVAADAEADADASDVVAGAGEEVPAEPEAEVAAEPEPEAAAEPEPEAAAEPEPEAAAEPEPEATAEPEPEAAAEPEPEAAAEPEPEAAAQPEPEPEPAAAATAAVPEPVAAKAPAAAQPSEGAKEIHASGVIHTIEDDDLDDLDQVARLRRLERKLSHATRRTYDMSDERKKELASAKTRLQREMDEHAARLAEFEAEKAALAAKR